MAASTPLQGFPDFDENTRATTFYTTGTTGLPKGVFFSHRQLVLHTLASIAALSSNATQGRRADGLGHGRAADDHLPAGKIVLGAFGVGQEHVQDGRHAMAEGHLFGGDEPRQDLGDVPARIDLLHAEHGGHVRAVSEG